MEKKLKFMKWAFALTAIVSAIVFIIVGATAPVEAGMGAFGITFFSGEFADNCITVQVRPVDTTTGEAVTYRFSWDGADYKGNPTYKMEPGKYYVLHPDVVTELEGLFALEFAEWSCGME